MRGREMCQAIDTANHLLCMISAQRLLQLCKMPCLDLRKVRERVNLTAETPVFDFRYVGAHHLVVARSLGRSIRCHSSLSMCHLMPHALLNAVPKGRRPVLVRRSFLNLLISLDAPVQSVLHTSVDKVPGFPMDATRLHDSTQMSTGDAPKPWPPLQEDAEVLR